MVSSDLVRHKMGFLSGQAQQKVLESFQKYFMKGLNDTCDGSGITTVEQAQNKPSKKSESTHNGVRCFCCEKGDKSG